MDVRVVKNYHLPSFGTFDDEEEIVPWVVFVDDEVWLWRKEDDSIKLHFRGPIKPPTDAVYVGVTNMDILGIRDVGRDLKTYFDVCGPYRKPMNAMNASFSDRYKYLQIEFVKKLTGITISENLTVDDPVSVSKPMKIQTMKFPPCIIS